MSTAWPIYWSWQEKGLAPLLGWDLEEIRTALAFKNLI